MTFNIFLFMAAQSRLVSSHLFDAQLCLSHLKTDLVDFPSSSQFGQK